MNYLLLIYHAEDALAGCSEFQKSAVYERHLALQEKAGAVGALIGASRLQKPDTATTLRRQDGRIVVTDGPFAKTKEALLGYYLLECADLDSAIDYAKMLPYFDTVAVEIRPVDFCIGH